MLMVMWRIWCVRNSKAHRGAEMSRIELKSRRVLCYKISNADSKAHIGTLNAPSNVLWSPPSKGVIKINTDGGISSRNGVAGIGFVMRGHNGSVVVAENRRIAYASSVIETKAKVILWAIQVALSKDLRNVILETDSSILADAFLHNKELMFIRGLLQHIPNVMPFSFSGAVLHFADVTPLFENF
uniref:Reverse transcriptase n=1 Tax=Tanacetum cinerariifolium TaxID=118510 RepID=A0A699KXP0_TANCI|nr:reverse transcriptase [Tanacetum cinerariifolium]